jgi:Zn-dependent protease with chaperone function
MMNSIWQVAILLAIHTLLSKLFISSTGSRHRLSLFLTVASTIWFLASLFFKPFEVVPLLPGNALPDVGLQAFQNWFDYFNIVSGAIYVSAFIWFSISGQMQWKNLHKLQKAPHIKAPVEWRIFTRQYAGWIGIQRSIKLVVSQAEMPATFGWLKPVILLPVSCLTKLSPAQVEAVILHELAHIKRNDYLWGLVLFSCKKILWFNPFAHILIKQVQADAENACDDLVLQFGFQPREYAFALLHLAKSHHSPAMAISAGGSNQFELLGRISRLLNIKPARKKFELKNVLFPAFVLLLSAHIYFREGRSPLTTKVLQANFAQISNSNSDMFLTWEQTVLNARLAIIQGAVGKRYQMETAPVSDVEKTETDQNKIIANHSPKASIIDHPDITQEHNPFVLSAGWVNEASGTVEAGLSTDYDPWPAFALLVEKLEETGRLSENEWQELMQYIVLHTELKESIIRETEKQQNPLMNAAEKPSFEEEKVLMIVYDEESGTLAASMVGKSLLGQAYQIDDISKNEQQVIFLHKKSGRKSGIINL